MQLVLEFRKPVDFKNGYNALAQWSLYGDVFVQINDITKDLPKEQWMNRKHFKETFNVTHIKTIVVYDIKKYKRRFFLNKCLLILMKWLRLA